MKTAPACMHLAAMVLCSLISPPVHAKNGSVDLVLSTLSEVHTVQMGETTVTARGGKGTVTFIHSSGAPFEEGSSATVQYASFARKTPSGFELEANGVATFASGDTMLLVFKRQSGDLAAGTSGEGTLEITGESDRFAGIKGQCIYVVNNLRDNWNVTLAKCTWLYSFPYR